ncbi:sigma 54-interacting transcriptional regulator [Fusobacterium sp.]|uniref:sigma-54 interaction domain-containing protein n=1 Tax=Fusobacterium sp. TaxID=68766 RepID=UPI0026312B6E|nr:sigma 54-interacting transcriptional regulator [Fusobacterium sp.]
MNFIEKNLNNIQLGIILCDKDGKAEFINDYLKEYFSEKRFNLFSIFKELNTDGLNDNFKILTKIYKNNLFFLFSRTTDKGEPGYVVLVKEKDFFLSILSGNQYEEKGKYNFENVIGKSPQITKIIEECKKISDNNSNVLITGESGTGKEFFARAIHNKSSRKNAPFIPVNCGAIPKDLIESELFGYESGAFTGANKNGYIGKFELANGGTIFLDEIGEMPLNMQVTLLRVLQDKCITRIGSKKCTRIDVRIIAATNKDLKKAISENQFRKDLYYRLNAFNIHIPPLKEREGDIPIFLDYLLKEKSIEFNKPVPVVSKKLFQKIISYCWPGNIRELENFVENFVVLDGISTYDINFDECHCMKYDNLGNKIIYADREFEESKIEVEEKVLSIVELEKREIKKAMRVYEKNITKMAQALGISRNALYNKMKRYNIEVE